MIGSSGDSEVSQTEKFIRSRKCVCLLLVVVLVAMIVFILLVTNVIPMRRADVCEKSPITITQESFGQTKKGKEVFKFTMKNSHGMQVELITLGATLTSLKIPDENGNLDDILLGFNDVSGYDGDHPFFGSSVGRYANRIAKGTFVIDGVEYKLTINDGENHLHGGVDNWSKRIWEAEVNNDEGYVKFTIISVDRDQGYPGKVKAFVTYQLTDSNSIIINFTASTHGKATPINLTNHAYFNLAGHNKGTIYEHNVRILANKYLPVTDDLIPTGIKANVSGTIFDLRNGRRLGDVLNNVPGGGYDHNFCLSGPTGKHHAARVTHAESGRILDVYTNQPGVQFYTGNSLDGITGKDGAAYKKHSGFCMETQNYPNAPNEVDFPDSILRPGSTYLHQCWYSFKW